MSKKSSGVFTHLIGWDESESSGGGSTSSINNSSDNNSTSGLVLNTSLSSSSPNDYSVFSCGKTYKIIPVIKRAMKRVSLKTYFLLMLLFFVILTLSSVIDATNLGFTQLKNSQLSRVLNVVGASSSSEGGSGDDVETLAQTYSGYNGRSNVINSVKPTQDYRHYPWTFECTKDKCQRVLANPEKQKVTLEVCWLTCGQSGGLWPAPVQVTLSKTTAPFFAKNFLIREVSGPTDVVKSLLQISSNSTRHEIKRLGERKQLNKNRPYTRTSPSGPNDEDPPRYLSPDSTIVEVYLKVQEPDMSLTEVTDESYELVISSVTMKTGAIVNVSISASTFFGARHGLETLGQLIVYDEISQCLQIVDDVKIKDGPAYPVRGLMIDTARNYIPIKNLYRMIDALAMNKMNTMSWHITDSNSFPFQSKRVPQMTDYGAYSPNKVYTIDEIKDLVFYAQLHGVRIIPELDAPAHAGAGWEWGNSMGYGDLAVCVGKEPWHSYCGQPPCGQLNPSNENVYSVLGDLYADMIEAFSPNIFHIGGDEVVTQCWEEVPGMRDWMRANGMNDHLSTWGHFQKRAYEKLKEANKGKPISAMVWSSGLTGSFVGRKFLNPENFIVQVWESRTSSQIADLLRGNYRLIFSNVDSMYLDFGDGSWLGTEHDYKFTNWQNFYRNDLDNIISRIFSAAADREKAATLVLGGIAALWSEKVDENNMDAKLWPRGGAVAERLWTNPKQFTRETIQARLNHHTARLKSRGIKAGTLQPESCSQMTGNCDDPEHPM